MKILNHKTGNARHALAYNEDKVEAGLALVLASTFNLPRGEQKILVESEVASVIEAHNARPNKIEAFGTKTFFPISPEVKERGNTLALAMEQFTNRKHLKTKAKTFQHLKFSFHPNDKNKLSNRTMRQITERVIKELGYAENPYIIYRHIDTEHPHVHVVLSRVNLQGDLASDSFDGLKFRNLERIIAQEFELTPSFKQLLTDQGVRKTQKWEGARMDRTGEQSLKLYVQTAVLEAMLGNPPLNIFVERLERRGVHIVHREIKREAKIYHGISYKINPNLLKANLKDIGLPGENFYENYQKGILNGKTIDQIIEQSGQYLLNKRGIPEFATEGRVLPELKPYSFRASSLGPMYQFESLTRIVKGIDNNSLKSITVANKEFNKVKNFTASENKEESSLIMAIEHKMENPILKILIDHPALKERIKAKILPEDQVYIDTLAKVKESRQAQSLERQYEGMYLRNTGTKATDETKKLFGYLVTKDYASLNRHLALLLENDKVGPDYKSIELFNLPKKTAELIYQLHVKTQARLEDQYNYFVLATGEDPYLEQRLIIESLASQDWNEFNRLLKQTSLPSEYLERLLETRVLPEATKTLVNDLISAVSSDVQRQDAFLTIDQLLSQFKAATHKEPSEGTMKVIEFIAVANHSAILKLIEEYQFYPDNLKPEVSLAVVFNALLPEEILDAIVVKGQTESKQINTSTAESKFKEAISTLDIEQVWERIMKDRNTIDYRSIDYKTILTIAPLDRNLYHYLLYKNYNLQENKDVAMHVAELLDSGISPHNRQEFAVEIDSKQKAIREHERKTQALRAFENKTELKGPSQQIPDTKNGLELRPEKPPQ